MDRRFLLRGLVGAALVTLLSGQRLGGSFGRGSSRGSVSRRSAGSFSRSRYGNRPGGVQDFVRQREGELQRDAVKRQRQENIDARRAGIARERANIRKEKSLVNDPRSPAPRNRLSDRLHPDVERLGTRSGTAGKRSALAPPSVSTTNPPGFLERHGSHSYIDRNTR